MSEQKPNYITPAGFAAMRVRYDHLFGTERPALVEVISWAAGNGDRSENGDYIYGRRKLREIDRELAHLSRRMKAANIPVPQIQYLFAFNPERTEHLSLFTQEVMRGPSPLTPAQRELIAAFTSRLNQCPF